MERYKNLKGNSGVAAYEMGKNYIDVQFVRGGDIYRYSYKSAGKENIEKMKKLAEAGEGLSTFISTHPEVRDNYEKK